MSVSAASSRAEQAGEAFRALRRGLCRSHGFSLHLCVCDSPAARDELIANLAASMPAVPLHRVEIKDQDDDILDRVQQATADEPFGAVMVVGLDRALDHFDLARRLLDGLNLRRAEWPRVVPQPVAFWVARGHLGALTRGAPDFFDWRSDTIEFPELARAEILPLANREWHYGVDPRLSAGDQQERVQELKARLASSAGTDAEDVVRKRLEWWDELAELLRFRGQLDEAVRIRTEEQLPVYERLGDVHSKAVTQGKIADILQARGQLDEALRIRTEEQLPVYERLGDVRSLLVGRTNLAMLYLRRGGAGDRERAGPLLCWSLQAARRLGLPEADTIQSILEQAGIRCDEG